jgi:hypothetical protein
MQSQPNLEQLIEEYLDEKDKRSIQQISIEIPGFKGLVFITDASKFSLFKPRNSFSLAIFFAFNDRSKKGQKLKKTIGDNPVLASFEIIRWGRNTIGYVSETTTNKTRIAELVGVIIQTLSPNTDLSSVSFELKRGALHSLG